MYENDGAVKPPLRTDSILQAFASQDERRAELLSIITERINRLQPIQEPPSTATDKRQNDGSLLAALEDFVEKEKLANNRLELIASTLQKIC